MIQITAQRAVERIRDYLVHKITLAELVDWAENSLIDGEFIHEDSKQLFDIAAHLGLSDSNQFALSLDELESIVDPLKRHIRGPGQCCVGGPAERRPPGLSASIRISPIFIGSC